MTAANLAHLPLQVGGVVLASAGRGALWLIARYMRAPLTHTAIAALVGATAMAGSNALFLQQHAHPAPMFASTPGATVNPKIKPVVPLTRPESFERPAPKPAVELKVPAATPAPALTEAGPIGNKDVIELQRKLAMLEFYTGKIDGLYGRRTAEAIRKFEAASGLTPRGELTRAALEAILAAPLSLTASQPQAPARVQTPAVTAPAEPKAEAPATLSPAASPRSADAVDPTTLAARQPLATPQPLVAGPETGSIVETPAADQRPTLLGRPLPRSTDEALNMAADTAGDAIDSIIANVDALTNPPTVRANSFATAPKPAPLAPAPRVETPQVAAAPEVAAPQVAAPQESATAAPERQQLAALSETPAAPAETPQTVAATPQADTIPMVESDGTVADDEPVSATDPVLVAKVQRGLSSLGFLHGPVDGVAGSATAKAIRNFETYFNFKTTGRVTPGLLDLLVEYGASI
ncbi:peptidoglycan-binding protein [Devosia sp.]|uniref:peptidoglycan-binding domain-containing protein n=1 Tax=Devosia sp. TaxID=1871048 RepID=UPI003A928AF3